MGRWLMLTGLVLVLLGAVLHYAPWLLSWFGRLPGDIRIEGERGRLFVPVTSMVLISVIVTLLLYLFRR